MSKSNPAGCKVSVDVVGLGEVLAGLRVLFDQEVVAAHGKPRNGRVGVGAHQFVSQVVQLTLFIQLDKDTTEQRSYFNIVRIIVTDFLDDVVSLPKVLLVKALFCLDVSNLV